MLHNARGWQVKRACQLLLLLALILAVAVPSSYVEGYGPKPPRWVPDRLPTTWTREAKGQIGENNVPRALKAIKTSSYILERRYANHRVLQRGIDALYRDLRTKRFNVVEAKATSKTGKLYIDLMPRRVGGERQMDQVWIRKKLDDANAQARKILSDVDAPKAERLSAHRTMQMIKDLNSVSGRRQERTLVITRLKGVESGLDINQSISSDLLGMFDHVIQVSRDGKVLRVHK